mgnify:CR=1 FL=1
MLFNKTRHIDYYIMNNISLEEIKRMQAYGTQNEIKQALNLPIPAITRIKEKDQKIKLADTIERATAPIVVYASGINDIMYQLHINPFSLKAAY